jgi:uncharacterized membrane-anchored protein YitT (DUF2179 family)
LDFIEFSHHYLLEGPSLSHHSTTDAWPFLCLFFQHTNTPLSYFSWKKSRRLTKEIFALYVSLVVTFLLVLSFAPSDETSRRLVCVITAFGHSNSHSAYPMLSTVSTATSPASTPTSQI